MKHIIIGSGITGLYLAYKLITKNITSPHNIIIIEKSKTYGGRIQTFKYKGFSYDVGAGRLANKHKFVMQLIQELNLNDYIIPINPNKNYFINGKLLNEQQLLKYYKSKFTSLKDLWQYAINYKSTIILTNFNLHNYFSTFLSTNDIKILEISFGYITEMYKMNAYDAIKTLKNDFDVQDNDFFILKGGLSNLTNKLYQFLILNNVQFLFNTTLLNITQNTIQTTKDTLQFHKLYITIPKNNYITIPYFQDKLHLFDSVHTGKLLRIYAKFDTQHNTWIKNIRKTLTDNKLQFIIPISNKDGLIQISYTDDYNADFWNNLNNTQTKLLIQKLLLEIFPNVTQPQWITKHFWDSGSHFWKIGVKSTQIQKQIKLITNKDNIHILGETYSSKQAWIEGSLETVQHIL